MPDILAGGAGLFGGLSRGLQLLLALRAAEEDRALRRGTLDVARSREGREAEAQAVKQANAPYEDIQEQKNRLGIVAALPDIRREYELPSTVDTYQQPPAEFPEFGAPEALPQPRSQLPSLDTSHLAQVLEHANRLSMHQRRTKTLDDVLVEAAKQAQKTQLPVSGTFETGRGEAELPSGFAATPERTFTPYQLQPRQIRDPEDEIFKPLLNDPIKQRMLKRLDPAMYQRFVAWAARIGERVGGEAPASDPKLDQQRADWDAAAAALRARGQDPTTVLGPRP